MEPDLRRDVSPRASGAPPGGWGRWGPGGHPRASPGRARSTTARVPGSVSRSRAFGSRNGTLASHCRAAGLAKPCVAGRSAAWVGSLCGEWTSGGAAGLAAGRCHCGAGWLPGVARGCRAGCRVAAREMGTRPDMRAPVFSTDPKPAGHTQWQPNGCRAGCRAGCRMVAGLAAGLIWAGFRPCFWPCSSPLGNSLRRSPKKILAIRKWIPKDPKSHTWHCSTKRNSAT